ncbi:MAG: thiol:disulfide interchange protein DsbA/DsbL [Gammaproteobacteria bacterium]|nr:thiol:disulfide interchange protein DsbA/DsbL [Gammaproteobacteria bacterium]
MMMRLRFLLLATVLSVVTACGKAPAPASTNTTAETTPIAAPAPAPDAAAETAPVVAAVEESAGTDAAKVAPASADTSALGKEIVLADNSSPAAKSDWQYEEGRHFSALTTAQGTSSSPGKIEVAEVFWYGCSHCYNLEPLISAWVKKLPADVSFVRIPVVWNPTNEIHARVYYTADALGKLNQITPAMFRAIHVENRPVTEEKDIQQLFEQEAGVSAADFNKTFRSFSVDSQLKRAKDLTVKYRVQGVPLLVIDGKYTTNGPEIRNQQDLLAVTEELIQRERQQAGPRS